MVPQQSEEAAGEREAVSRIQGWAGGWPSAEGLCKALGGSASSCQPQNGMAPSPTELRGCSCPRGGDAGGLCHSASQVPWSPLEVLLDQMLIEVLQLRLQELHEWGDGLQREEGDWGGQGGRVQQGTAGQGGSLRGSFPTEHGQAVPAVLLLLTRASSEACGGLGSSLVCPVPQAWAGSSEGG